MILPQHQPHLPSEMPCAYLVRVGTPTEHDCSHYQDMHDGHAVDQMGCFARRDAAKRRWGRARTERFDLVQIGTTDVDVTAYVFYRADEDDQPEVLAVFDASTWEDVTGFVDTEWITGLLPDIDREAERRDEEADVKMRQQRENE